MTEPPRYPKMRIVNHARIGISLTSMEQFACNCEGGKKHKNLVHRLGA